MMKFSCEKALLQSAIAVTSRAVAQKSSIPALEGLFLRAGEELTVSGYNMNTGIRTKISASVNERGEIVLNARLFGDIIRRMPDDVITFSADERQMVHLSCGDADFDILGLSAADYPDLPEVEDEYSVSIQQKVLRAMIEETSFAVSSNESRPVHTGALFEIGERGLTMVAVDGYRLAWDVDEGLAVRQPFMVLPEALKYLKMFGNQEVTASVGEWYLQVTDGTTELQTRIGGPFVFNVDGAVPKEFKEEFCVWPEEFLRELDYLKNLTRSIGSACVRFSGGKLSMLTPSGGYCTQIQIDGESSIDFGFELRYMIDALRQFRREPQVKLKVINPVAPIILEAEGRSDFAMVLPVRMKQAAAA